MTKTSTETIALRPPCGGSASPRPNGLWRSGSAKAKNANHEEDNMDWKAKLQSAKGALDQDSQRKLEEHWPKIQQIFEEKVGPAALAAANDDATMTAAIKVVYLALPFPVHLVVKEPV